MSETAAFELDGLEELAADLQKASSLYPDETKKAMKTMAANFCKDVAAKEPDYDDILATKQWKKEVSSAANNSTVEVDITNTHPLHHLLENGHEKWFMGNHIGGWVPGKHYTEKTRQEWNSNGKVAEELDEVMNKVFKKVNL
jgi:hypothetical protein